MLRKRKPYKVLFHTKDGVAILAPVTKPANITMAQARKAVRDALKHLR